MQNAHIWLALPDHTLTRLLFLYTNSSGFVSMKLLPYRYLIEIFDPHLETSALVQVYEGMTTTLTVFASGSNHPIAFQEVHNQNVSGWVPSTGSIYVGIRSDARVANVSGSVFLEQLGGNRSAAIPVSGGREIRATVLDERLGNGMAWLQVRPSQPLRVPVDLPNSLVTYRTTYTIGVESFSTQSSPNPSDARYIDRGAHESVRTFPDGMSVRTKTGP